MIHLFPEHLLGRLISSVFLFLVFVCVFQSKLFSRLTWCCSHPTYSSGLMQVMLGKICRIVAWCVTYLICCLGYCFGSLSFLLSRLKGLRVKSHQADLFVTLFPSVWICFVPPHDSNNVRETPEVCIIELCFLILRLPLLARGYFYYL